MGYTLISSPALVAATGFLVGSATLTGSTGSTRWTSLDVNRRPNPPGLSAGTSCGSDCGQPARYQEDHLRRSFSRRHRLSFRSSLTTAPYPRCRCRVGRLRFPSGKSIFTRLTISRRLEAPNPRTASAFTSTEISTKSPMSKVVPSFLHVSSASLPQWRAPRRR